MKNAVLFSSTSQLDVVQAISKGMWEHTKCPANIKQGDVILVIPNAKERKIFTESSQVAVGTVASVTRNIEASLWASNTTEGSNKQYEGVRVEIKNPRLVKFSDVKEFVSQGRFGPSGIRSIDVAGTKTTF